MSDQDSRSLAHRLKGLILGKARDIKDPRLFHSLTLVAFFAWVGLGADGLSSSSYGPEEAFLALGQHPFLGLFVALATAVTIFVIAASYSQIVELFPGGGGGYLVASKLLSPTLGMISGCALLIDYLLTITLSIASGADAIFSFLPAAWQPYRLPFAMIGVVLLTVLNMRGVKESVVPLVPIFLIFLATHAFAIIYTLGVNFSSFGELAARTSSDIGRSAGELGTIGTVILILRSYSMGAGTFTGIEAVSNGMPILREPKVQTAKRTMRYMAISLAFTACGLMVGYLLYRVGKVPGRTLNAVLLDRIASGWGSPGYVFILVTLISEAVLLFVAAQAGFLDGPRVLANMSMDRWLPQQFSLLSERLVIKNGILLMGGAAAILMIASRGSVQFLVVLYAINVFITFFLSQLGMVRHWWKVRKKLSAWRKKFFINGIGLVLCGFILVSQVILKFGEGGWITLLITGSLVAFAFSIKRFYRRTHRRLARLDHLMAAAVQATDAKALEVRSGSPGVKAMAGGAERPAGGEAASGARTEKRRAPRKRLLPNAKTAVILVSGFNGTGLHTLLNVRRLFSDTFRNYVFMQAGVVDADRFKGAEGLETLQEHVQHGLHRYVDFMQSQGIPSESFSAIGTDVVEEIQGLARLIFRKYPNCVFFGGQIVFPEETLLSRLLYNHVTFAVQRRLHQDGIPFLVMPVRVK